MAQTPLESGGAAYAVTMTVTDGVLGGSESFRQFLRDKGRSIESRAGEAGYFEHNPTRGVAREDLLREPLAELLPARYGVVTGEVRAANDEVSTQWDVLIYDRLDTPILYGGQSVVLPIEGVLAAISVKSTLDGRAIGETAQAAARLRSMPRYRLGGVEPAWRMPAVYAFGFQGLELKTLRDHMAGEWGADSPSVLNGACVLGKGVVLPCNSEGGVDLVAPLGYRVGLAAEGAWGLFVSVLWGALAMMPPSKPNLFKHVGLGNMLDPPAEQEQEPPFL